MEEETLFMEFVGQRYLPHVRAREPVEVARREEMRATALIWEFGGFSVSAVKPEHVERFRDRIARRAPAETVHRYLALLSRIYARATEWGFAPEDPTRSVGAFPKARAAGAV